MIRAYNDLYLFDVQRNLADFFDIAIYQCHMDPMDAAKAFLSSKTPSHIEARDPTYLTGKTGLEMLIEAVGHEVDYRFISEDRSDAYWAGHVLAYCQWYLDIPFATLLDVLPFAELMALYNPYHEAPEGKVVEYVKARLGKERPLQRIRKQRGLSQRELALLSGVKLRSIQCYEQGDIDIRSAQAGTLLSLAKTLGCTIEDLLREC